MLLKLIVVPNGWKVTNLVGELSAEDFEQVSDVPWGSIHVVMDLPLADGGRLAVHDDLFDYEPHSGETLPTWGIFPDCFFVNFMNSGSIETFVQRKIL